MEAYTLQDEVLVVVTAWARPMIVDVGWRIRVADDGLDGLLGLRDAPGY